jgi:transketolase
MRKEFSTYIEKIATQHNDIVFITGDLGYNALENLAAAMGNRFINAGVAEQNMIGVAAGMAYKGYRVICYSIAPFVVYRCLEQVRNDVCFHNLPVFIVGNGGGYGYGIMGSSHHCIEDIACFSGLPNMQCYVPAFVEDLDTCLTDMFDRRGPAYLRLGLGKNRPEFLLPTSFGAATELSTDAVLTIILQSPVANNVVAALAASAHQQRIDLFVIDHMPFATLPDMLAKSIRNSGNVLVVEEHIATGGLGQALSSLMHTASLPVHRFIHLHAAGYPGGLYGSQSYHQQMSGLDESSILQTINSFFQPS